MIPEQLRDKIDHKTKPLGALGRLEELAQQIGIVQNTLSPSLRSPTVVVFAGDHGIASEGVSAYPPEVTFQMVLNFLQGGAAINVFCQQNGLALHIVDAGVKADLAPHPRLIDAKIAKGTQNYLTGPAMTEAQLAQCLAKGAEVVAQVAATGCNVIGFGEMGIGNTSAASLLLSALAGLPLADCVGRGTGLDDAQLARKLAVLTQAQDFHGPLADARQVLQTFAGFEMAQMCGAMLAAQEKKMLILIDGFIVGSVFLVASQFNPALKANAIFCHRSQEQGSRALLQHLGAEPLLDLDLRLGEGTGCALAYPLVQAAVNFLNQMASFAEAGVANKA
jgi:nicotinate-nucleotide--dimethylbenzimidazole phosphoribosyltransferase